ncbi:MAG: serine/threonine protein kinase [Planctomycetota bacterium]|nr:serine/threonine protein kinase [Planctomycetota bacterium]
MASKSGESTARRSFSDVALEMGLLTQQQLDEALVAQQTLAELGVPDELPAILVKKGILTEDQVRTCEDLLQREAKRIVAGFEILSRLGHGAMGAVYKARQISMDRIVALKILPPKLARDLTFRERFFREARASGRLDHLHIVHGIDVGEHQGVTYFAMEFVDGNTVKSELQAKGRLPWREAVDICRQVANALGYAWKAQGLVHRDIKPDNMMLTRDGVAKLCDLGLAKEVQKAEEAALTQSGQAVGTPHYISPEQAKGKTDIDTRSDLYSLGASLYHMVSGKVPFEAPTPTAVMVMHVTDEAPSPRAHAPDLPEELEWIVAKAMAKEPADRYQTPADMEADLKALLDDQMPAHVIGFTARSSVAFKRPPLRAPAAGRRGARSQRATTGKLDPVHARTTKKHAPVGPRPAPPPTSRESSRRLAPVARENVGEELRTLSAPQEPVKAAYDSQAVIETVKGVKPIIPDAKPEARPEPLEVPPPRPRRPCRPASGVGRRPSSPNPSRPGPRSRPPGARPRSRPRRRWRRLGSPPCRSSRSCCWCSPRGALRSSSRETAANRIRPTRPPIPRRRTS